MKLHQYTGIKDAVRISADHNVLNLTIPAPNSNCVVSSISATNENEVKLLFDIST